MSHVDDLLWAFQSGASFGLDGARGATLDAELYATFYDAAFRGPLVEYGLQKRPTYLLWRGDRTTSGLRDSLVLRRIGRDAP